MAPIKTRDPVPPRAFVERFQEVLREKGFGNTQDFCRAVYGINSRGQPNGSGTVYPVLRGTQRLTRYQAEMWAPTLGIPADELLRLTGQDPESDPEPIRRGLAGERSAAKLLASGALTPPPPPPAPTKPNPWLGAPAPTKPAPTKPAPAEPPLFSFVVEPSGLATLRVNIANIPFEDAAKVLSLLQSAGLLNSHERSPAMTTAQMTPTPVKLTDAEDVEIMRLHITDGLTIDDAIARVVDQRRTDDDK